jgi:formylglycine-generating enzyme required for sulfatase activity
MIAACLGATACASAPADRWEALDSSTMICLEGGSFAMGDVFSEGAKDELPVHEVTVSAFCLGEAEITVGQFARFVAEAGFRTSAEAPADQAAKDSIVALALTPGLSREERLALASELLSFGGCARWDADQRRFGDYEPLTWAAAGFEQDDSHPAVCLSWDDAASYANWVSGLEGLPPAYRVSTGDLLDTDGHPTTDIASVGGYRLPTEAEWEFAAREGGRAVRFGNGKDLADPAEAAFDASVGDWTYQVRGPLRRGTSPVRSYLPNALGFHDLAGNAWEWISDFLARYPQGSAVDPYQSEGFGRAVRGGRWGGDAFELRAAKRFQWQSNNRCTASGFRLARSR